MKGGIRTYTVDLPAGAWIQAGGSGLAFVLASAAYPLTVQFFGLHGEDLGTAEQLEVGDAGGPGGAFSFLRLYSAQAQTIRYHTTAGSFAISKVAGEVNAAIVPGATLAEIAPTAVNGGACVQIAAADSARRHLAVFNPDTHTGKIYLRSNNTLAASAFALYPGEKAVLECSDAIFCYNPEAGAVSPLVSEVK